MTPRRVEPSPVASGELWAVRERVQLDDDRVFQGIVWFPRCLGLRVEVCMDGRLDCFGRDVVQTRLQAQLVYRRSQTLAHTRRDRVCVASM